MRIASLLVSSLFALTAGCAASSAADATSDSALSAPAAPAALRYTIAGGLPRFDVTGTDEYLHAGQSFTLAIGASDRFFVSDQGFWSQSSIDGDAKFFRGGAVVGTTPVSFPDGFAANANPMLRVATSAALTIPDGVDSVTFELTQHYQPDPALGINNNLAPIQTAPMVVIGAYTPDKLALFDTDNGATRDRVLEGGDLVAGADVTLAYTDYRVETVLDSTHLDLSVAQVEEVDDRGGDYGPPQPLDGTVDYEVWASVYDNVNGWTPEVQLTENQQPELLVQTDQKQPRFDFTRLVAVPASANSVQVYFHTKAFLTAPTSYYGKVISQRFAPGSRTQIADHYDNPNGASTNYSFTVK